MTAPRNEQIDNSADRDKYDDRCKDQYKLLFVRQRIQSAILMDIYRFVFFTLVARVIAGIKQARHLNTVCELIQFCQKRDYERDTVAYTAQPVKTASATIAATNTM